MATNNNAKYISSRVVLDAPFTVTGALGQDPERLNNTAKGESMASFSICKNAYNFRTKTKDSLWYRCLAFGQTADSLLQYKHKGDWLHISATELEMQIDVNHANPQIQAKLVANHIDYIGGGNGGNGSNGGNGNGNGNGNSKNNRDANGYGDNSNYETSDVPGWTGDQLSDIPF